MKEPKSVCIIDFCGTAKFMGYSEPVSMWCDYWPADKKTTFGGVWFDVPAMELESQPTEEQCTAWAKQHSAWEKRADKRRADDKAFIAKINL